MNSAPKIISWALPLFFIIGSALTAVEPPVIVSARLHCLSLGNNLDGLALIKEDGKYLPIVAPKNFLSPAYDYQGPALASVVRMDGAAPAPALPSTTADEQAAPPANLAAQFTLPANGGEFLLLFATEPSGALRVGPVDFSPKTIPAGYYLVWNISGRRIGFAFGKSKLMIEPGQSKLMTPGANPDTYVPLRVFDEHNNQPRLIVSGRQFNRANARQIMLFYPSDNASAPVKMRVITDLLPVDQPDETPSR